MTRRSRSGSPLAMLHIGKTGGSALYDLLDRANQRPGVTPVRLLPHRATLPAQVRDDPNLHLGFIVREPVARAVSGFLSRQRKGQPRTYRPWSPEEEIAFTRFPTPEALGLALADGTPEAEQAAHAILHLRLNYVHYLGSVDVLQANRKRLFFVGAQEALAEDVERLKRLLGIPADLTLPADPVVAHVNPDPAAADISPRARQGFEALVDEDRQLYDESRRIRDSQLAQRTRRPARKAVAEPAASISPYHAPGFYDQALAAGRHRDIVGGRWKETGEVQMALLRDAGLQPHHKLLDIGAGSLRLGCRAVPYLDAGNYWATDLSLALMQRGWETELAEKDRLPLSHLVQDEDFSFPGLPADFDHAIAFAVFTHLPMNHLRRALISVRSRFPALRQFLFTVFLAPDAAASLGPVRQPDGVVTHPLRAPYHMLAEDLDHMVTASGFRFTLPTARLPRGQVLVRAEPA